MTVKQFCNLPPEVQAAIMAACPDKLTRETLALKCKGTSWSAVTVRLGGIASPDCYRTMCARYLRRV